MGRAEIRSRTGAGPAADLKSGTCRSSDATTRCCVNGKKPRRRARAGAERWVVPGWARTSRMTLGSFFIAARRRSRLSFRMAPSPRAMARARAETKASSASSSSWLRSTGRLVLTYLPVGGPKDMALERSSETRYETGDGARTISRVGHVARGAPLCRERSGARPLSGARGCPPCCFHETSMATDENERTFL